VFDEAAKEGLYEQAATQAGVPVVCRKEPLKGIERLMPQSADAVVVLSRLQEVDDLSAFLKAVHRILKTGGRCECSCGACHVQLWCLPSPQAVWHCVVLPCAVFQSIAWWRDALNCLPFHPSRPRGSRQLHALDDSP
jgi:hypothetical protein